MLSHEPLYSAARDILAFPAQLMPDLASPVSALALVMDTLDLLEVLHILCLARPEAKSGSRAMAT